MKIVIAPDSYKECLSAAQVADAMAQAATERFPEAEVVTLPLADGGEGTLDALAANLPITIETTPVHAPMGRPIDAKWGLWDQTAIIEVAQACGLQLLQPQERNPLIASSRGAGELIMAAYEKGCRHFIVGLGGTATCDGGMGILSVPGIKEVLADCSMELLCDVNAPFVGPHGAARIFAPQKGATPEEVEILESRMVAWAKKIFHETGFSVAEMPGAGAAGGIAGALISYAQATLVNGAKRIMDLCGFDKTLQGASLVITGEGKSDSQTLMGKVPVAVLRQSHGTPTALVSGRIEDRSNLEQAGFQPIVEVSPRDLPIAQVLHPQTALRNLRLAILQLR